MKNVEEEVSKGFESDEPVEEEDNIELAYAYLKEEKEELQRVIMLKDVDIESLEEIIDEKEALIMKLEKTVRKLKKALRIVLKEN